MTKAKYTKSRCSACGHVWQRPRYAKKACPNCNSPDIQEVGTDDAVAPPAVAPEPEPELIPEPTEEPGPPVVEEVKPKAEAAVKPKVGGGMSMSMAIPAKSEYVNTEELTPQEQVLARVMGGVGIKQPTALAQILGRGPADDAKWVDKILSRHGISYQQRLLVHDVLFPGDMDGSGDDGGKAHQQDDIEAGFGKMFTTMQRMWMMKMMMETMGTSQGQHVPLQPTQTTTSEPLVTMMDPKTGLPMLDAATGQPVKVPASMYLIYTAQQRQEQPSTLMQFMQFNEMQLKNQMEFFKALGGGNQGGGPEQMKLIAEKLAAENRAQMEALNAQRQNEITTLKAQLAAKEQLEQQANQYGRMLAEKERELEAKMRELEKAQDAKTADQLSVQTDIQRKTGEVMTEAVKGATAEFREGRKEVRSILLDQARQQQIVDGRGQQQATTTSVQEVPLVQVERELGQMEQAAGIPPPPAPAPQGRRREVLDLSVLVGGGG